MQQFHHNKLPMKIILRIIKLTISFSFYLFISIFYQKLFGIEPFNNSFSIGFPRFYFEFYTGNCQKLNGSSFGMFLLNVIIYAFLIMIYHYFKNRATRLL